MEVVCVRQGDKYGQEYVLMLRRMVKKFLNKDLICLGDDVPMKSGYEGFWSKMELFSPWVNFRPCLYFDLDTFILDDCTDLLIETDDLWLIRDFYNKDRSNSGVMILPTDTERIWENHFKWTRNTADGDFLTTQPHRILQDRFMGITSRKVSNGVKEPSRITSYHGHLKPHNDEGWGKEIWKTWTSPQFSEN